MLHSTLPHTRGKIAAIARSKYLTDFQWTPIYDIPTHIKENHTVHPAGVTVTGMPYSSVEANDKFIGENVSFETFITAVNNPKSVLYTRDQYQYANASTYYGCVCNEQVRYALAIDKRYICKLWAELDGMYKVKDHGQYTAEDIELCDVLHVFMPGVRNHVALITDILRNDDGVIEMIEVSEAVHPHCIRKAYTLEEYFKKYEIFDLWRYKYVDDVPNADSHDHDTLFVKKFTANPGLALNYGTRSNYLDNKDVMISIFNDGENTLEIFKDGELLEIDRFNGEASISRCFDPGYYTVKLANTGEEVFFCINAPKIKAFSANNMLTVTVDPADEKSSILYMDFRAPGEGRVGCISVENLTEEERASGKFTRPIPEGAGNFKVFFRNPYGIWTSGLIKI